MEISRKNISTEDIVAKESELIEKIKLIKEEYDEVFGALGYELELEFLCRGEYDDEFFEVNGEAENYVNGYVSRANFTVKRKLTGEEPEITVDDDYETEEEREVALGALLAQAEREREVAYTEIMIMRMYKSFWVEKVSVCDDLSPLSEDFNEFAEKLRQMN